MRRFPGLVFSSSLKLATVGCLAVTVFGFCGAFHWYLDQFSHLRPQYLVASGFLLACFILAGRIKWAFLAGSVAVINMVVLLSYSTPLALQNADIPNGPDVLHAATINVLVRNDNHEALIKILRERQPDVVAFQEMSAKWRHALREVKDIYPHQSFDGKSGSYFQLGFISKRPWRKKEPLKVGNVTDGFSIDFEWQGKMVSMLNIHAPHPTSAYGVSRVKALHDSIAQWVQDKKAAGHEVIVLGDFNCSPWSSHYARLMSLTDLQDTGRGRPFDATRHFLLPDRLFIDHVFLHGNWTLKSRETGADFGSDHRPVFVSLKLN